MRSGAITEVLEFYKELPFNANETPRGGAEGIKECNNIPFIYPNSDSLYYVDDVLEIGCGAGWMSNSLAYHYGLNVTGIDFNPVVIEMAKKIGDLLGNKVEFVCTDLFQYECKPKDIVISNGVLHHTRDCMGGIRKCIECTKAGGDVFIGLYHKWGRKPFLDYFKNLKTISTDEDFLFKKYYELDKRVKDETKALSWFRDQVLHPYESQHTLKEVYDVFIEMNVELICTSINQYEYIEDITILFEQEKRLYDVGMNYLEKKEYYPGFFYVLGRKK